MKKIRFLAVIAAMTTVMVSTVPVYATNEATDTIATENEKITDLQIIKNGLASYFLAKGIKADTDIRTTWLEGKPVDVYFAYFDNKTKAEAEEYIRKMGYDLTLIYFCDKTDNGSHEIAEKINGFIENVGSDAFAYQIRKYDPDMPDGQTEQGKVHVLYYDESVLPDIKAFVNDNINDPNMVEYINGEPNVNGKISNVFEVKRLLESYVNNNGYSDKISLENSNDNAEDKCWTKDDTKVFMKIYDYSNAADLRNPDKYSSIAQNSLESVKEFIEQSGIDENAVKIEVVEAGKRIMIPKVNPNANIGDANEDGYVNVRDCAFIANKLASGKGDTLSNNADYNQDGKKNVRDAASLSNDLANK